MQPTDEGCLPLQVGTRILPPCALCPGRARLTFVHTRGGADRPEVAMSDHLRKE